MTAEGRLLLNFESLLRRTFGRAQICARTYYAQKAEWNFTAGQSSPLAIYSLYFYTFAHPRGSVDRIAGRPPKVISFGNYPLPVLIRGHLISCAAKGHRYLISYASGVGLALGCLAPQP